MKQSTLQAAVTVCSLALMVAVVVAGWRWARRGASSVWLAAVLFLSGMDAGWFARLRLPPPGSSALTTPESHRHLSAREEARLVPGYRSPEKTRRMASATRADDAEPLSDAEREKLSDRLRVPAPADVRAPVVTEPVRSDGRRGVRVEFVSIMPSSAMVEHFREQLSRRGAVRTQVARGGAGETTTLVCKARDGREWRCQIVPRPGDVYVTVMAWPSAPTSD